MTLELIRFLAGALVLLIPGIFLAAWLKTGRTILDQLCHGSCLGLALACYLASLLSHVDLRWFYPLWGAIAAVAVAGFLASRFRRRARERDVGRRQTQLLMAAVLVLVALTRFGTVLHQELPRGWDPTFHLILAKKIQLSQHAIFDWSPFETAKLNYPTGSHVLLVVLAAISRLPLETVFKNLIPLLGVLSTAQVFLFVRKVTADSAAGLYAAIAYGFWAIAGSIGYYLWGGLPNELAMLLFLAMLTLWLEQPAVPFRVPIMAVLYGGVILVHHHVMVTSAAILAVCFLWALFRHRTGSSWKILAAAVLCAVVLDAFFLVPYASHVTTLHSTHVFRGDEPFTPARDIPQVFGVLFFGSAVIGLIYWAMRRASGCHFCVICAAVTLVVLYVATEYILPRFLHSPGQDLATVFTPSRFLTDLTYCMAVFIGLIVVFVQRRFKVPTGAMVGILLLAGLAQLKDWADVATPRDLPPGYIEACRWINQNTPETEIVYDPRDWTSYLTWRRTIFTPMPISEPIEDRYVLFHQINALVTTKPPPKTQGMDVVRFLYGYNFKGPEILWNGPDGIQVVRMWPQPTS